jgi:hypothetical protein
MNYFVITSGIHGPYGVFTPETRLEQTLQTANSIREKITDAVIILAEGGAHKLSPSELNTLATVFDRVIDYTDDSIIQFAHNAHKTEVISLKGPCESRLLSLCSQQITPQSTDRIFKLSGRYCLSEDFSLDHHTVNTGKWCFLQKQSGERYNRTHASTPWQYKTRLYSWCGTLHPTAIQTFQKAFNHIVMSYTQGTFIDIEHTMWRMVNPSLVAELSPIGVTGLGAVDGVELAE